MPGSSSNGGGKRRRSEGARGMEQVTGRWRQGNSRFPRSLPPGQVASNTLRRSLPAEDSPSTTESRLCSFEKNP